MPVFQARPFVGSFNSTAFHVEDPVAFEHDPMVQRFRRFADVLEGQMPDDPAPCFALAKGMVPRDPLFVGHQPATVVIGEAWEGDPEIDDAQGWIAMFQKHLRPEDGIIVTELGNPVAPGEMLTWVITVEAARCYLPR